MLPCRPQSDATGLFSEETVVNHSSRITSKSGSIRASRNSLTAWSLPRISSSLEFLATSWSSCLRSSTTGLQFKSGSGDHLDSIRLYRALRVIERLYDVWRNISHGSGDHFRWLVRLGMSVKFRRFLFQKNDCSQCSYATANNQVNHILLSNISRKYTCFL